MSIYRIVTTNANGDKFYFNHDYCVFSEKFATEYKSKNAALDGLAYAKKCASNQIFIDNMKIEKQ